MRAEAGDIALVRRVQKGDKAAFDALVLKYQHKVLKLVQRYVRNPAEAEDIAQEAFIKAYRALPAFRGDSAFYTWLYRIAINTAKNALVANRRRPVSYDLDLQDGAQVQAHARLSDTDRVQTGAAQRGMLIPPPGDVGYLIANVKSAADSPDPAGRWAMSTMMPLVPRE